MISEDPVQRKLFRDEDRPFSRLRSSPLHRYEAFRDWAKSLLKNEIAPHEASQNLFSQSLCSQGSLFLSETRISFADEKIPVPKEFISLAKAVSLFRDLASFEVLYSLLWRIQKESRSLLQNALDQDVLDARRMERAVKRDIHKMHAFVRFRKTEAAEEECFVAFHRPDHCIIQAAVPFFVRRFKNMRWRIETPDAVADWDRKTLIFTPGVSSPSVQSDPYEEDWKTYYKAISNPARLKLKMMKKEMPTRYWETMPETSVFQELLREAEPRVEEMLRRNPPAAQPKGETLEELQINASSCRACPLHQAATQTVFGEGPRDARLVLVGEQAGDEEDTSGRPFLGPAGVMLNQILREVGLRREEIYITNAVKHFKFEERGKVRLHKKPDGREIHACKPWLFAELALIRPEVIVCLGATAAQSLLGRAVNIKDELHQVMKLESGSKLILSYHPSAILRSPSGRAEEIAATLVESLRKAQELLTRTSEE